MASNNCVRQRPRRSTTIYQQHDDTVATESVSAALDTTAEQSNKKRKLVSSLSSPPTRSLKTSSSTSTKTLQSVKASSASPGKTLSLKLLSPRRKTSNKTKTTRSSTSNARSSGATNSSTTALRSSSNSAGGRATKATIAAALPDHIECKVLSKKQYETWIRQGGPHKSTRDYFKTAHWIVSGNIREMLYRNMENLIGQHEVGALYPYGGRQWKCHVEVSSEETKGPLWIWNTNGELELACLPTLLNEIPLLDVSSLPLLPAGFVNKRSTKKNAKDNDRSNSDDKKCDDDSKMKDVVEEEDIVVTQKRQQMIEYVQFIENLQSTRTRQETEISRCLQEYFDENKNHLSSEIFVKRTWICPMNTVVKTRKEALELSNLYKQEEALVERYLNGIGNKCIPLCLGQKNKPTRKQILKAGRIRFARDGLWVIGQEDPWQYRRYEQQLQRHNREQEKQLTATMTASTGTTTALESPGSVVSLSPKHDHTEQDEEIDGVDLNACNGSHELTINDVKKDSASATQNERGVVLSQQSIASLQDEEKGDPKVKKQPSAPSTFIKKLPSNPHNAFKRWRLSNEQVGMCFDACMNHYQQVITTIQARALHNELLVENGFDVFRQRGRGRFDMQLKDFDEGTSSPGSKFGFLHASRAPWMEVVHEILGSEATLIHKGCFLSLPHSETQIYHQDGVHLSQVKQKPCYAVNVFVPLINMSFEKGPTEFCLGTHFLGNEHYQKSMVETPLVDAGIPIIFDYRLGHRGLANTSNDPRPILYLTYARDCSSFKKDKMNFNLRGHCKLGPLISEVPLSREERLHKRQENKILNNLNESCSADNNKKQDEKSRPTDNGSHSLRRSSRIRKHSANHF